MMTFNIYLEANSYAEDGWTLELVRVDDGHYDYKANRDDAIHIHTIELPEPTGAQLVSISEPAIRKMEDQIARAQVEAKSRLEEFKSKFILLENDK